MVQGKLLQRLEDIGSTGGGARFSAQHALLSNALHYCMSSFTLWLVRSHRPMPRLPPGNSKRAFESCKASRRHRVVSRCHLRSLLCNSSRRHSKKSRRVRLFVIFASHKQLWRSHGLWPTGYKVGCPLSSLVLWLLVTQSRPNSPNYYLN